MKKYLTKRPEVEFSENPHRIALLEQVNEGLVLRHFEVVEENTSLIPNKDVQPAEMSSWAGYASLGADGQYVEGDAFPEAPAFAGKILREVERQAFNPEDTTGNGLFGSAEVYDFVAIVFPIAFDGKAHAPYNHFVEGQSAKAAVRRIGQLRGKLAFLTLSAAQAEAPLSQWSLIRSEHPFVTFVDRTTGTWANTPASFSIYSTLPSISLSAPASVTQQGATVEVSLVDQSGKLFEYDGQLVVEPLAGYVNKRRIQVTNGVASFKAFPLGLEAGETMRVKVGTQNISGLADVTLTVA